MSGSLRITMVSAQAPPALGGIEAHIDELGPRLVAAGHAVTVVTTDRSGSLPRSEVRGGMRIERYAAYPRAKDWYFAPALGSAILRSRPDVVHVQGIHTLVAPLAMIAGLRSRRPVVLTGHTGGTSIPWRARARSAQFRVLGPLLRRIGRVIAVSEHEAQRLTPLVGSTPIRVVRNGGVDVPPVERAPDPDLVVSVGRLERYKGHHRLIAALPLLREVRPAARLLICGAGPAEDDLRSQADELGVAGAVEIAYFPPDERRRLAETVAGAGVFALLSDYESHPVAVMEALALGRSAVVLDNSGLRELARAGLVEALPEDSSSASIAARLAAHLASTARGDGPERRPALPTWQTCTEETLAVYREVVEAT